MKFSYTSDAIFADLTQFHDFWVKLLTDIIHPLFGRYCHDSSSSMKVQQKKIESEFCNFYLDLSQMVDDMGRQRL